MLQTSPDNPDDKPGMNWASKFPAFDKSELATLTPATIATATDTATAGSTATEEKKESPTENEDLKAKITDLRVLKGEQDGTILQLQQDNDALKVRLKAELGEKERLGKSLAAETSEKEKLLAMLVRKDTEYNMMKEVRKQRGKNNGYAILEFLGINCNFKNLTMEPKGPGKGSATREESGEGKRRMLLFSNFFFQFYDNEIKERTAKEAEMKREVEELRKAQSESKKRRRETTELEHANKRQRVTREEKVNAENHSKATSWGVIKVILSFLHPPSSIPISPFCLSFPPSLYPSLCPSLRSSVPPYIPPSLPPPLFPSFPLLPFSLLH
jgi:hypothetical protein